ncbi:hypothetical protein ES703_119264 [subsurface metagenome]
MKKEEKMRKKCLKHILFVGVLGVCLAFLVSYQGNCQESPADQLEKALEYVAGANYGQAVEVLENVLLDLREKAPLKIENTALVNEIHQFGMYDERENSVFVPGETILIYSELRNFTSETIGEKLYAIRINEDIQILDVEDNLIFEQKKFVSVELTFKTRGVTDLMLENTITLDGLPSGNYKIKITVTDIPSGKKVDFVVPISIREKAQ